MFRANTAAWLAFSTSHATHTGHIITTSTVQATMLARLTSTYRFDRYRQAQYDAGSRGLSFSTRTSG